MAKKILKNVLKVVILVLVYLTQIYVVNNTSLFGVNGDMCLIVLALIALLETNTYAYIMAGICGVISDVLFSSIPCRYLLIYIIVVSVLIGFKKMYKQDSKMAIIIFAVAATVISEILMFVFNIMLTGEFVNIFTFIFSIIKQGIINIFLAFVIYLAFRVCNKEG